MLRAFAKGLLLSPIVVIALALFGNFPNVFRWLAIAALAILALLVGVGLYDSLMRPGQGDDEAGG